MAWTLKYLEEYTAWIKSQSEDLQDEATAHLDLVEKYGPLLGRPYADTLHGSKLPNLKELRFAFEGAAIRILFAFDPKQQGVIILGGDKTGDKRWYDTNMPIAEKLYAAHLEKQAKEDAEKAAAEQAAGEKDKKKKEKKR